MEDFFNFSRQKFFGTPAKQSVAMPMIHMSEEAANCINSMPLTMAYVPMQSFGVVYEPEKALCMGTVFPDLDKPFTGCKNWREA